MESDARALLDELGRMKGRQGRGAPEFGLDGRRGHGALRQLEGHLGERAVQLLPPLPPQQAPVLRLVLAICLRHLKQCHQCGCSSYRWAGRSALYDICTLYVCSILFEGRGCSGRAYHVEALAFHHSAVFVRVAVNLFESLQNFTLFLAKNMPYLRRLVSTSNKKQNNGKKCCYSKGRSFCHVVT